MDLHSPVYSYYGVNKKCIISEGCLLRIFVYNYMVWKVWDIKLWIFIIITSFKTMVHKLGRKKEICSRSNDLKDLWGSAPSKTTMKRKFSVFNTPLMMMIRIMMIMMMKVRTIPTIGVNIWQWMEDGPIRPLYNKHNLHLSGQQLKNFLWNSRKHWFSWNKLWIVNKEFLRD